MTLVQKINALLTAANAKTSAGDASLTEAVQTLIDGYGSDITVEPITITSNGTTTAPEGKAYSPITVNVPEGYPTDISTASGMSEVLIADNIGKAYKFTGTTDATYTNGDIYVVEEGA